MAGANRPQYGRGRSAHSGPVNGDDAWRDVLVQNPEWVLNMALGLPEKNDFLLLATGYFC